MKKLILLSLILSLIWFSSNCFAGSGEQLVKGTFTTTISNIDTVGTINKGTISIATSYLNNSIFSSSIIGCSSIATFTGTALTNQLLIPSATGKTLYILGIDVYNLSTTGGNVNFYWDAGATQLCYPSAIGSAVGNGYIVDLYRYKADGGLYITTIPTSIALTVYYIQQE